MRHQHHDQPLHGNQSHNKPMTMRKTMKTSMMARCTVLSGPTVTVPLLCQPPSALPVLPPQHQLRARPQPRPLPPQVRHVGAWPYGCKSSSSSWWLSSFTLSSRILNQPLESPILANCRVEVFRPRYLASMENRTGFDETL